MRLLGLLFYFILIQGIVCLGQLPTAAFHSPSAVCMNESLVLQNNSAAATHYVWDFCHEDLKSIPSVSLQTTLPSTGGFFYHSIRFVFDNGEWIGFATDLSGIKLYRLDFGTSLTNTPTVTNLGTLSGLGTPGAIEFVQHSGTWYAFVLNLFGNSLVRITFGNGIKQIPTLSEDLGNVGGVLNTPSGLRLILSGSQYLAIVVNLSSNTLRIFDFGNSPANTPTHANTVGPTGFNDIYGIAITKQGSNWFALVSSFSVSKTYLVSFGTSVINAPTITEINGIPQASDLEFAYEGENIYAMARSRNDGLYRIDFGTSLPGPPIVTRLGTLGLLTNESRNIALVRDAPNWTGYSIESATGKLHRMDFIGNCSANVNVNNSAQPVPVGVFYKTPGTYIIELTAKNTQGLISSVASQVTVSNQNASGISINKSNEQCTGNAINFGTTSSGTMVSYGWNYGDSNTSNGAVVNHAFVSPGTYTISLEAIETNGCKNSATEVVTIFDAPVANFDLPVLNGIVCTSQGYSFTNTTTVDVAAPVIWSWQVDGNPVASAKDLIHSFPTVNTYNVTLQSSIPGCSNSTTKSFQVAETGPQVGFTLSGQCLGDETQFTNTTGGTVADYLWNFGDGQTSTQTSPSHKFLNQASFSVILQATNAAGCTNSITKNVQIADTPQPDFYIDLPPFSCSGTPTQFHDATPAPTDGNVTSWKWTFGVGGATSTQQSPLHTYHQSGTYPVKLEVETNFGCVGTAEQDIFIAETPAADFSFDPACLNQGTQFQSLSMVGVQSWQWTIGNTAYSFSNPTHTFTQPGSYSAMLVVVGQNACEALATKTIDVKAAPQLDFTNSVPCSEQIIAFTDQSTGNDLPQTWNWIIDGGARTGSPTNYTFETAGAKSVQMNVITAGGCQYSITKNLIVAPSPTASFILSNKQGPPPLQVLFTNTSQNATAYAWDFGLSNATSILVSPSFTFNTLGDYLVELTASNSLGCSDTFTETVHVVVPSYNLTLETISVQQSPASSSKSIVASITNNSNLSVLETDVWLTGSSGLRIKANIEINLAAHATGEFTLPLEVFTPEEYLCVELSPINDTNSSDNQRCENLFNTPALISPYPNPTRGPLWFDVVLNEGQTGTLSITDVLGQRVFSQAFSEMKEGLNRIAIDLSGNHAGLYLAVWEVAGHKREFTFLVY